MAGRIGDIRTGRSHFLALLVLGACTAHGCDVSVLRAARPTNVVTAPAVQAPRERACRDLLAMALRALTAVSAARHVEPGAHREGALGIRG